MYSDRQTLANSVNPDQTQQNTASDQGLHYCLHYLPLIQQFETLTGSKKDLLKSIWYSARMLLFRIIPNLSNLSKISHENHHENIPIQF